MNYQPDQCLKGNILIVDDTPDNLRLLSTMLYAKGYQVRKALSGKFALQGVEMAKPDLILLDINMPVMSGWDFLNAFSEIKHKLAKVPAIYVLSSTLWPPELERISSHPMISGFISKPFKVENALQLIQQVT